MAAGVSYTTAQLLQAQAIVDEMLLRGVGVGGGGGGTGGGGDASAANQTTQINRLVEIRDRLIELVGYTDGIESLITTLNTYVDGLEALQASTNSTSAAISTLVDQLEGYTDGIESNQATQTARLETIRASLPSQLAGDRFKVESQLTTTARTTSFINTTTTGTIATGANSVAIANIGALDGTVKGVNLPAGASISFAANGNDTLDAIIYSATGTNLLITTVV